MRNKIIACILALQLILCAFPPVYAYGGTISINSAEDFAEFAKSCTLDSRSREMTVSLGCDIDFSDCTFVPVPTFGGVFNGNGHTLSGISFGKKGSYYGVFRYIQPGGAVTGLTVKGKFLAGGSKSYIGGIAGENSGSIENCSFVGAVEGENAIGGIVGVNTDTGRIVSCTVSGSVTGESLTGGIAGKSSGSIAGCTNNAAVNTAYEEKKSRLTDIDTDVGAIVENYKSKAEEDESAGLLEHSDTGGIAGFSSGIISGCENNASVGCKHIGYNVGGIAGRQSGYMIGCKNNGLIRGRKDVGGIVGQAEPYLVLNVSESILKDLRSELKELNSRVNSFITDADTLGDDTKKYLDGISEYVGTARDNTETMLNMGADFADDNLDEINAWAAILSNTLDKLSAPLEKLEDGGEAMAAALDKISAALDTDDIYFPDIGVDVKRLGNALSELSKCANNFRRAISRAKRAKNDLGDAVSLGNTEAARKAISELSAAAESLISANNEIKRNIEEIESIIGSKPEDFEKLGANAEKLLENLKLIGQAADTAVSSLTAIKKSLAVIIPDTKIDFSKFRDAAEEIETAADYLDNAMYYVSSGLDGIGKAINRISDTLDEYSDDITPKLNRVKEEVSDGIRSLSYAADDIKDAIGDFKAVISDLAEEEPLELVKLGDDFRNAGEELFGSLSGMSDEIAGLKSSLYDGGDKLSSDLISISNQFETVVRLLADEADEIKNGSQDLEDIFVDASDEDIKATRQGKLADCRNFGRIEADRNIGGIAGAVAIEYSKDPEDDIEKPDTLNFTYRTKAVLQGCINDGAIVGKKACAGGIAGLAEIGTIYECENYAEIELENGGYAGGIAGKSGAAIRRSYAKSAVTAKSYVGGIAGKGEIITASCAISEVSGDESIGAVCGGTEDLDSLYKNYYLDNGLGAVDGVSYISKAEPISYEELRGMNGVPSRFISFTVSFTADGKIIEEQAVEYGEDTARIKYPSIPKKDGFFGKWCYDGAEAVTEDIVIECEYKPYITILASDEKNSSGKLSLALAEGNFTDEARLCVSDSAKLPPVRDDRKAKVYDISLLNTELTSRDTVTLRLLNESKDKATVWCLNDGKWEEIKTSKRGKYIIAEVKGSENTLCIGYTRSGSLLLPALGLLALAIAAVLIFLMIKRKRKR